MVLMVASAGSRVTMLTAVSANADTCNALRNSTDNRELHEAVQEKLQAVIARQNGIANSMPSKHVEQVQAQAVNGKAQDHGIQH